MKKIEINYTTNEQLWTLETVAEAHGYTKTNDCYWAQIFENAAGDQIITSREDTASADPAADLAALLDENTTEATENTTEAPAKAETITAASTRQAWEIAGEILGTDYTEDAASTARAGYPIHRSTAEGNRGYICDLGDRLEVNLQDGSSRNIWISREALADEAATAQKIQKLREAVTKQAAQVEELTHAADLARYLQKEAERERDEATADRDRIAEELRELKNKLFHLSLVST